MSSVNCFCLIFILRGYVSQQIVSHTTLQIMICMRKRVDKNLLLGFELQVTLESIKIKIRQKQMTELIHLVLGLYYCLLRQDALEELFGPDPHNEGFKSCSNDSRTSGVETACAPATPLNRKVDISHFNSAEKDSLDRLDASMTSVGATVVGGIEEEKERGDDWHRSSLNSDVDPPHVRLCVVIQISEATLLIYVDPSDASTRTQDLPSMSGSDADDSHKSFREHLDRREAIQPLVLIVSLSGFVHTTVWPEHASLMQAVQQITLRDLKVTGRR